MSTDVEQAPPRLPTVDEIPAGRWLMLEGMRLTAVHLAGGWRALPAAARRRWARTMAIGFVLCCALALLADAWVRGLERSGALAWEADVLRRIEGGWLKFSPALWIDSLGNGMLIVPLVTIAATAAVWAGRPLRALALLLSFFGADVAVVAGWLAWDRARPDLIAGGIAAPGLHSFPSGHVAQTVAAWGMLAYLWMATTRVAGERVLAVLCWLAVSACVGATRMRLGAHWPTDVAAGAAIGAAWLAVCILALRRAESAGGR